MDPMIFDYKADAEAKLEKLISEDPTFTVDLLRFAVDATPEKRVSMLAALQLLQKKQPVGNAAKWFRYLLAISFWKAVLPLIDAPRESQLRLEYDKEKGNAVDYENKIVAMKKVIAPKVERFFRRFAGDLSDDAEVIADKRDEVIEYCANFLLMYFDYPGSSQTKFVDLYKEGIWCFSI